MNWIRYACSIVPGRKSTDVTGRFAGILLFFLLLSLVLTNSGCALLRGAANTPPSQPDIVISPSQPIDDDDLTCTMITPSQDEDGDDIIYSYYWFKGSVLQQDLSTDTVAASHTKGGDVWSCKVIPSDGVDEGPGRTANVTVNDNMSIVTPGLPDAILLSSYSHHIVVRGGVSPYTWAIMSGSLPEGLSLNGQTGEVSGAVSGIPTTTSFVVKVTDAQSHSASVQLSLATRYNGPPVLAPIGPKSVEEGQLLTFTISATDPDNDIIIYEAINLPDAATFNPAERTFNWRPNHSQTGIFPGITFKASDSRGGESSEAITITVVASSSNRAPELSLIGDRAAGVGQILTFTVTATDPDGNPLTYSARNLPTGATFDTANNNVFSWRPEYTQIGTYPNVHFEVTDGQLADFEDITITVTNSLMLSPIGNKMIAEGQPLTFTLTAANPSGQPLTYSASNLPSGATFNTSTHIFTWTPNFSQAGAYEGVRFDVTDGQATDYEVITITVVNTNRAPVLDTIGDRSVVEGQPLSFIVTASDPDGDALTYSCPNPPSGATFVSATFSWTPAVGQTSSHNVTFAVTDSQLTDSENITITVTSGNRPPVLSPIGSRTVDEGQLLSFIVMASDPDGDTLTYSCPNPPSGASFVGDTFTWNPGLQQAGTYNVTFAVTDNQHPPVSEDITITVNDVTAPVFGTMGTQSTTEGVQLSFAVLATDDDGDPLTYSASGLPDGASFVGDTFTWTPAVGQAGTYTVHFQVTDGHHTAYMDVIIEVAAA